MVLFNVILPLIGLIPPTRLYYGRWRDSPPIAVPIWEYGDYSKIHDTHYDHYRHYGGYEDKFKPPSYDFPFNVKMNKFDRRREPCEQDKKPVNPFQNGYHHPFYPFNGNRPSSTTSTTSTTSTQQPPPPNAFPDETTTERMLYTPPPLAPTEQQTSTTENSATYEDIRLNQQQGTPVVDGGGMDPMLISMDSRGSIDIQKPFVRPSFRNTTYLQKCGEVFRRLPVKAKHTPIFNGRPAKPQEFPHMALLGFGAPNNIQWLCGGSLISDQYVLTAAHCIFAMRIGLVRYVRLGELDLSNSTEDSDVQDYVVRAIIRHPLYSPRASYHDIALLQLNATVSFSSYIRPICLATTRDLDNKRIVAAGWGLTKEGGEPASILQRATFKIFPFERCRTLYGMSKKLKDGLMEDIQLCAEGVTEIRDACKGDSGGPMQYTNYEYNEENLSGFTEIVGVTSFGGGACGATAGVYTRVLPYVRWIERIAWPNEVL